MTDPADDHPQRSELTPVTQPPREVAPAERPEPRRPYDHRSGSIPPERRRLAALVFLLTTGLTLAVSLTMNAVSETPIHWFWLAASSVMLGMLMALFLWVRLSQ